MKLHATRVVRNKKAAIDRVQKVANGKTAFHNFGDEVQQMINRVQTDEFVRCVLIT